MRKIGIMLLVVVMVVSLCACGRKEQTPIATNPATTPATVAPTEDMTLPTIDPTMGTNIPDPEVDPNSTMDMTDPYDSTGESQNGTANAGGTEDTPRNRRNYGQHMPIGE